MSKTITVSDETYKLIRDQVEKDNKESQKTKIQIKTLAGEVLYESEKTTIKEAVVEAAERGAYLADANLRGAYLADANLRGAYLAGADLADANLRGAYLAGADLADAYLGGANLGGAYLAGADFFHAKFYGKGGQTKIKKNQVDDFFKALGVIVEE